MIFVYQPLSSTSDANFNFTEIDARVETSSQGRYLFGYIFIAGGLGTLIVTLVFSDSEFSFGVENAATIQTGVIISIIVFVVITGGVGSNMEGNDLNRQYVD